MVRSLIEGHARRRGRGHPGSHSIASFVENGTRALCIGPITRRQGLAACPLGLTTRHVLLASPGKFRNLTGTTRAVLACAFPVGQVESRR